MIFGSLNDGGCCFEKNDPAKALTLLKTIRMKNLSLLLSISLLSSLAALAQNWAPLNLTDQYNYRLENSDDYISNVLWVDSVTVSGGDSVFHLNRVVIECDTCTLTSADLGFLGYCDRLAKNQGQFLQKRMIKMPDGAYRFEGRFNFTLNSIGKIGDSWIFSDSDTILATIVDAVEENLFLQPDSVKIIELSNGQVIRLSKNFGILEFPKPDTSLSYTLVGIEGRNLGAQMPDYRSVYDFEPGDVLQYRISSSGICGIVGAWSDTKYLKFKILHTEMSDSSTVYQAAKYLRESGGYSNGSSQGDYESYSWDTIIMIIPHYSARVNYPGSYWDFTWENPFPEVHLNQIGLIRKISVKMGSDSLGTIECIKPVYFDCNYSLSRYNSTPDTSMIQAHWVYQFQELDFKIKEKRGVTWYKNHTESGNCSSSTWTDLTGYKIGLDSAGIIHPDSFYYPIIEEEPDSLQPGEELELLTFPNPVSGEFQLQLSHKSPEDLRLEIFNTTGQAVLRQTVKKDEYAVPLDLSNFPRGYYIIRLKGENTNIVEKILKL